VVSMPSAARRKPEASTKAPTLKKAQGYRIWDRNQYFGFLEPYKGKAAFKRKTEAYNVNVKVA